MRRDEQALLRIMGRLGEPRSLVREIVSTKRTTPIGVVRPVEEPVGEEGEQVIGYELVIRRWVG